MTPAGRDEDFRPTPEELLPLAHAAENSLGRLQIFLGYAPGVGKTYAMLEAARKRRAEGGNVVAAYVESHGRPETDALLAGLEVIPRRMVPVAGMEPLTPNAAPASAAATATDSTPDAAPGAAPAPALDAPLLLPELDLDAVLARRPAVALVDELAHTNAPGCRHEKRWQDVEELLAAGIDVYTTVNIQHFESLTDVVSRITGIAVRETVPDRLLDDADVVRLVDIPHEDLLQRLAEGKVYVPQQAARAMENFFRPGNLLALRELSLRRTASRVDDAVRAYMRTQAIAGPWPAAETLLVCVSGSPYSESLLRTACRLAEEINARWYALHVDTPDAGAKARENRQHVWHNLRLAESMGAQTATVTESDVCGALLDYARRHNVTKIVMGRPRGSRWMDLLHPPLVDRLLRQAGAIDVVVPGFDPETPLPRRPGATRAARAARRSLAEKAAALHGMLLGGGLTALVTAACWLLRPWVSPVNIVICYLMVVVYTATRFGRTAVMVTSFLGVLAFDFFFVEPIFAIVAASSQYILTFLGLFAAGAIISTLMNRVRARAVALHQREALTDTLYRLSRDLSAAADRQSVIAALLRHGRDALDAPMLAFLPDQGRLTAQVSDGPPPDVREQAVADWVFRCGRPAGQGTDTLASTGVLCLPVLGGGRTGLGVLGVRLAPLDDKDEDNADTPPDARDPQETMRLLEAFAAQASLALDRMGG